MKSAIVRRGFGSRAPVLVIILVAYLMIVIDMSITITALPQIREAFGMTEGGLSWVQNAYLLAYGGTLLMGARMGDLFGRRRMFVVGVATFAVASLAVRTALSAPWLLAARGSQGLAAAILAPSALSLLQSTFLDPVERSRAVAYYSTAAGAGGMIGLVVGGVLTAWLSWRIGFLVNVPIGVLLIVAARRHLTETTRISRQLDLVGAASSTLGMTALVYGLVRVASTGWAEAVTAGVLVIGTALLGLFVTWQARTAQPLMPLRLFASRVRSGAYATRFLFVGAITGFLFFMTQYLQRVLDLSPLVTAIAFLPMTVANFAGALAVPKLSQSIGSVRQLVAATTVTLLGMAWLSRLSPGAPYLTSVALPMLLIGIGGGACLAPMTSSGISGVPPEDAGAASGLVNVSHQLGGSVGLGVLLVVFASGRSPAVDDKTTLAHGVVAALVGSTAMLALALLVILVLIARFTLPRSNTPHSGAGVCGPTAS